MQRRKILQHAFVGAIARLGALCGRKPEPLKKHGAELSGRVDVKLLAAKLINFIRKRSQGLFVTPD